MEHADCVRISGGDVPGGYRFGSKGMRLLTMSRAGFRVPDGLLLSVEFMNRFVRLCGVAIDFRKITRLEQRGNKKIDGIILDLFKNIIVDEEINTELITNLHGIEGFRKDTLFAVRSAALGEDAMESSFAGQYTTILGVGLPELWDALIECYASWWSGRAVAYRRKKRLWNQEPQISVIIQKQLDPEYSGVLFTHHPMRLEKSVMVIEAVRGLGEKLVSGEKTPARWEIDRASARLRSSQPDPGREASRLKAKHLKGLVALGEELEQKFGTGLDIEWAIEDDRIFILQMRPITTHEEVKDHIKKIQKVFKITPEDLALNIFSRSIVDDLWSDRMSTITSSIVFDEFSDLYTFKKPLRRLRLRRIADLPGVKVVNGYGYMNCQAVALLLEYLPPALRFREIQNIFPPSTRQRILKAPFNPVRLLRILPFVPLLFDDPAILPFLTIPLLRRHLKKIEGELNRVDIGSYRSMDPPALREELERVLVLQSRLQVRNQWGYGNATLFTWLLHHVATKFFGKDEKWVLDHMTRIPSNVTFESQVRLEEICRACDDEIIRGAFARRRAGRIWETLSKKYGGHPVTALLRRYISDYRYRSANRDFIHARWDEKPELVIDLVSILLETGLEHKKPPMVEISLKSPLSLIRLFFMPALWLLVVMTKRFLALREDLRFGLDKCFYRIRKILLAVAGVKEFRRLGNIEDGIFFLNLNELRALLSGKKTLAELVPLVRRRKEAFFREQNQSPPYYIRLKDDAWEGLSSEEGISTTLRGIPASPGRITGKVRIIRSAEEFHKLKKGEILIAFNTDPGWTPLFMNASGVVVEMGGILNHCAIVAREYGVPAIVGVEAATRKLMDGQVIKIDGSTGIIEML